jgi:hypothetical protein
MKVFFMVNLAKSMSLTLILGGGSHVRVRLSLNELVASSKRDW